MNVERCSWEYVNYTKTEFRLSKFNELLTDVLQGTVNHGTSKSEIPLPKTNRFSGKYFSISFDVGLFRSLIGGDTGI